MAGTDTVRGIGYQQAQAVVEALALLDHDEAVALRVEGLDDVVDVETLAADGTILLARQFKVRAGEYTWGKAELINVMRRWAALPAADDADFEFVTDGRLGPTGVHLQAALRAAQNDDMAALSALLGEPPESDVCQRLMRARVRLDPVSVGALLLRSEQQVASILPGARTVADALAEARAAVDGLFRLLMERAGHPDAEARVVNRQAIADVLGVPAHQGARHRWPGTLRGQYLAVAGSLSFESVTTPLVAPPVTSRPEVRRVDDSIGEVSGVLTLLDHRPAAIVAGPTGAGKSIACRVLVRDAAVTRRVVLMAHAEAYLPGRLSALAADAISDVVGDPLPSATGRQALSDPTVTLVVDGVSEVPAAFRDALAEDLLAAVAAGRGAAVVLVGRDIAALRATLPTSVAPAVFSMADLGRQRRTDLARRLLVGRSPPGASGGSTAWLEMIVARVEHALRDAAGNALLFSMAVTLVADGVPFTSRATLYEAFVEKLAARVGATGIIPTTRILGIVYAGLLDDGRRYADPYEWTGLVERAVASQSTAIDALSVDAVARRVGIVTTFGYTQTVVPMHDSFADYLAGAARAAGLVDLPVVLQRSDEQRVAFAAEIAGVDADLAARVSRDLPFHVVRLAEYDRRPPADDTPEEVAGLLHNMLPADEAIQVALWRHDGRVVAFRCDADMSRWVDDDAARLLLENAPWIVSTGGPFALAARLWRQTLRERLVVPRGLAPPRAASIEEACQSLTAHTDATMAAIARLIGRVAPATTTVAIAAQLGPLGLTARVRPRESTHPGAEWPVLFVRTDYVDVQVAAPGDNGAASEIRWVSSTVDAFISKSPEAEAAKRLTDAINRLAGRKWI